MPKNTDDKQTTTRQLSGFFRESRKAFSHQYTATGLPSVLIAQNVLETCVEQGMVSVHDGLATIRDRVAFAECLLKAEEYYQKREDQKIHEKMTSLERNTHWKAAAAVSLVAGTITGVAFAMASPFITAWLQPTVDEMFKRKAPQQAEQKYQPPVQNVQITNNNGNTYYIIKNDNIYHVAARKRSHKPTTMHQSTPPSHG
jgi:hypothetical protein